MGVVSGVVVFLLIWWVTLMAVLPFGHSRDADGTPVDPQMKKKLLWTSLITLALWCVVYGLIEADIISFRELAEHMVEEDRVR